MRNKLYTLKEFIQLSFCENGRPSSKRVVGAFMIFVVMIVLVVTLIIHGVTPFVENLAQTALITGASLLGLSSVTSIWKHGDKEITTSTGKDNNENLNE